MDELWFAWAAGFFDGEGCVRLFRHKDYQTQGGRRYVYDRYMLRLIVGQKVRDPLDRFTLLFGGGIVKAQKDMFHWQLTGAGAVLALRKMLPYLTVKLSQANLALDFWERRQDLTDTEKDGFVKTMSDLKKNAIP